MSMVLVSFTSFATILIFTLSLFVSPSFRDDALQQLKKFYHTTGDIRINQWNKFLNIVGDDPEILWGYGEFSLGPSPSLPE